MKRNGEHLTDFTRENGLTRLYTKFQKRKGKLWTYINPNNGKAHPNDKKWINRALNCEAYSSFADVSSDYRIDTSKIRLSRSRNRAHTTTSTNYDWSLLNNKNISDKYMRILSGVANLQE